MKIAVLLILSTGILLTLWITYSIIYFFFGDKIKAIWQENKNMQEAKGLQKKLNKMRMDKLLERNKIEEVVAEDCGRRFDEVKNGIRKPNKFIILDITNTNALSHID